MTPVIENRDHAGRCGIWWDFQRVAAFCRELQVAWKSAAAGVF